MVRHFFFALTHWDRVTHICVGNLAIIGLDNGLSPGRRQAITWANDGLLLIGPLGTNFSQILLGIQTFSFKKMHFKMSSVKWCPFYFGLNVLTGERKMSQSHTYYYYYSVCYWYFLYNWKSFSLRLQVSRLRATCSHDYMLKKKKNTQNICVPFCVKFRWRRI